MGFNCCQLFAQVFARPQLLLTTTFLCMGSSARFSLLAVILQLLRFFFQTKWLTAILGTFNKWLHIFCAKGVVLQNANRSLKFNSFVQEGLLFARPRIFDPQSSSNLTLPPDLRSQIMDRKVWRPRFQLLPITRPGRPFCKISPNSPGCPWASLFRVGGFYAPQLGLEGLLCSGAAPI